MRFYLISVLIGLMTAIIASNKGYNFLAWWVKGTLFAPFSLLYVLFLPRRADPRQRRRASGTLIQCPHCKELIAPDARRCRYCRKTIEIIDV